LCVKWFLSDFCVCALEKKKLSFIEKQCCFCKTKVEMLKFAALMTHE